MKTGKPRLTLRKQFEIPVPYRAWCHICPDGGQGFMSLGELNDHTHQAHSNNSPIARKKVI